MVFTALNLIPAVRAAVDALGRVLAAHAQPLGGGLRCRVLTRHSYLNG
jgi:hypothetical protein